MDAELTDVDEKEDEEAEGTVAPETEKAEEKKKKKKKSGGESENSGSESRRILGTRGSPEGPVQRSVPADERAGGEEQEPEQGQAEVHPVRRVHAEPGQAAEHVHEERAGVNWERRRSESSAVKQHRHLFLSFFGHLSMRVLCQIRLHIQRLYMIFTVFWNSTGMSTEMSW